MQLIVDRTERGPVTISQPASLGVLYRRLVGMVRG